MTTAGIRFTVGQVLTLVAMLVAGALAWGDLKGDLRVLRAETSATLNDHERRVSDLEGAGSPVHPRRARAPAH